MKKISFLLIGTLLIAVACHRKTLPSVADRPVVPATPVPPIVPAASIAEIEAGKVIFNTKCSRCHATKPVEKWTADGWAPILRSMIPKAKLDSIQSRQVTSYVMANARKVDFKN